MRKKLDKIFALPTACQQKVYVAKGKRRQKKSWWQQVYSLFF